MLEQNRPSVAFGYARIRTDEQAEHGLSLEAQQEALWQYYVRQLQPRSILWGGVYADAAAIRLPLADRKAGKVLCDRLKSGDHVVMVALDRGFQHMGDAFERLGRWLESGVHVHLVRNGLDTTTPEGTLFPRMLTVMTEFWRATVTERAAAAQRSRRRAGTAPNQYAGYGFRLAGRRGRRRKVADPYERDLIHLIAELHDEHGLTFEQIWLQFLKHAVRTSRGKAWSLSRIKRAYAFHAELQRVPADDGVSDN